MQPAEIHNKRPINKYPKVVITCTGQRGALTEREFVIEVHRESIVLLESLTGSFIPEPLLPQRIELLRLEAVLNRVHTV